MVFWILKSHWAEFNFWNILGGTLLFFLKLWCFFWNLVTFWWKFGGILVEVWWQFGGSLVEVWWQFGGSLVAVLVSPFTCKCKLWNCHQTAAKLPPNFHQISTKMASIFRKNDTTSTEKYGRIHEHVTKTKSRISVKETFHGQIKNNNSSGSENPAMSFHEMFELFFGSVTTIETKGLRHEQSTGEKTLKHLWEILRRPNHT